MKGKGEPQAVADDRERAALVGRLLREARRNRGLTLEQVGVAIRVAERQVLAVEEGRVADLPPQPYARGLVCAYASLLGLEPEELLRACGTALAGDASGRSARIFRYPVRERLIWREWAVPLALAAGVATIVIARAALTPPLVELSAPVPETAAVARPVRPAAVAADPAPSAAQVAEEPAAAPGVRVLLRCEGTTWAEAAADGAEPRRHELGPGQILEITAREKLSLSLGDAGVVRLGVNGRELGFIGYKGETKLGLSFAAVKASPAPASLPVSAGD